jgi:hypothetical protein
MRHRVERGIRAPGPHNVDSHWRIKPGPSVQTFVAGDDLSLHGPHEITRRTNPLPIRAIVCRPEVPAVNRSGAFEHRSKLLSDGLRGQVLYCGRALEKV